jgi:hypothetical protein
MGSDHCHPCSLSQWGIWIKAGVAFDNFCIRNQCHTTTTMHHPKQHIKKQQAPTVTYEEEVDYDDHMDVTQKWLEKAYHSLKNKKIDTLEKRIQELERHEADLIKQIQHQNDSKDNEESFANEQKEYASSELLQAKLLLEYSLVAQPSVFKISNLYKKPLF